MATHRDFYDLNKKNYKMFVVVWLAWFVYLFHLVIPFKHVEILKIIKYVNSSSNELVMCKEKYWFFM